MNPGERQYFSLPMDCAKINIDKNLTAINVTIPEATTEEHFKVR